MTSGSKLALAAVGIGLVAAALVGSASNAQPIERELEEFILAANQGWVEAARTLNDRRLSEWFSGEALEDHVNQLLLGREHQARIEYEKPQLAFKEIRAPEGSGEAKVVTEEGWAFRMVDASTGQCLSRREKNSIRVTYRLKRPSVDWTIFSVEQEYLADRPASRPCTP